MTKRAKVPVEEGTLIHGTMITVDIAEAVVSAIETLGGKYSSSAREARKLFREIVKTEKTYEELSGRRAKADEYPPWSPDNVLWEELVPLLEEYVPDGMYFGAHPGDGSDYGFWRNEDEDEDEG